MAEQPAQERTEAPTERRRQEARKKGQVPRSRELTTTVMLIGGVIALWTFGLGVTEGTAAMAREALSVSIRSGLETEELVAPLARALAGAYWSILPVLAVATVIAAAAPALLGGMVFNIAGAAPKPSRLDPLRGLGRIFGVQGLMELLKALGKVALVGTAGALVIWSAREDIAEITLSAPVEQMGLAMQMLLQAALLVSLATLPIAAIDVPFQLWQHTRQLRMTRQEIRDELKENEGRPEVRERIRRTAREIANRRMIADVPEADVVVVNPAHYAVALRYDGDRDGAPRVIASGVEEIAQRIREAAEQHAIPILSAPPLARALYATTRVGEEVPADLYLAVARVLAWVLAIDAARQHGADEPLAPDSLEVPASLDPHSNQYQRAGRSR